MTDIYKKKASSLKPEFPPGIVENPDGTLSREKGKAKEPETITNFTIDSMGANSEEDQSYVWLKLRSRKNTEQTIVFPYKDVRKRHITKNLPPGFVYYLSETTMNKVLSEIINLNLDGIEPLKFKRAKQGFDYYPELKRHFFVLGNVMINVDKSMHLINNCGIQLRPRNHGYGYMDLLTRIANSPVFPPVLLLTVLIRSNRTAADIYSVRRFYKEEFLMTKRRRDSKGRVLKKGEQELANGTYRYDYIMKNGKRCFKYAKTLEDLRQKEEDIVSSHAYGIRPDADNVLLNNVADTWFALKKGLKDNTFQNYKYMYDSFVRDDLGKYKVKVLRHSDVLSFYNTLIDERGIKWNTIEVIQNILHQVLDLAVQDNYLRTNPSSNALKHFKQARNFDNEKKRALTREEQDIFLNYLSRNGQYHHWYSIFYIMLNTGMRVGEITGLRWQDVDLDGGSISVNHTLVYYNHKENGCYFNIHTPKTKAGERTIPILNGVKEAFIQEEHYQREAEIECTVTIDGYTNFVFVNRFGNVHNQGTLNKAIRRITRDCNEEIIAKSKGKANVTLLPRFSCHSLRHTFATRLCESGVNIKVIQDVLGHADFNTTMNVYTDATKDLKQREFKEFDRYLSDNSDEKE